MTLFSSKTPRDLNCDPAPWRVVFGPWRGARVDAQIPESEHKPRPEFDHVQHNAPNPILVALRRRLDYQSLVGYPSTSGRMAKTFLVSLHVHASPDYTGASDEHIAHARRVLTRLARLTKETA